MPFWIRKIICLLLPCLLPCAAWAVPADTLRVGVVDSMLYVDEVVVSGMRSRPEVMPVQTLAGERLAKLNAHSVADALRYFSGVQLKDYGGVGGLKTINVRSLGSQHTGVFYDGIEIGNAQNGIVDLGRFSLDNMEAVSLYNGQKSAIFQPARDFATASAIYLRARTPVFSGGKNYNIKATFKTGSFGLANPSVLWEQRISKNVTSSFTADYLYSNGRYKFKWKKNNAVDPAAEGYVLKRTRHNGDIGALRVEHALTGQMRKGEWRTRVYSYLSERGYPGSIRRGDPDVVEHRDRQWDKNIFVQASVRQSVTDFYTTQLAAKFAYDHMRYRPDPNSYSSTEKKYIDKQFYVSSANMFGILPWWSANLSVDFQWEDMDSSLERFTYPTRYTVWAAAATSVSLGGLKAQASLLATIVDEDSEVEKETQNSWMRWSPSVVLSWQPWKREQFHLRAFYKRTFRLPTFNELYCVTTSGTKSVLRPETATQYDLGVTYSRGFDGATLYLVEAQADAYYNEVKDKIVANPGGQASRFTMQNIPLVKITGVDASVKAAARFGRDLRIDARLNYTWQQALDHSYPELEFDGSHDPRYKGQIGYVPRHSGSAVLSASFRRWDLNYSYVYTGKRYTESSNETEVGKWYTHDLSLARSLDWGGTLLRLTCEVNNLFDRQYEIIDCYPMPGINFKVIVSVAF